MPILAFNNFNFGIDIIQLAIPDLLYLPHTIMWYNTASGQTLSVLMIMTIAGICDCKDVTHATTSFRSRVSPYLRVRIRSKKVSRSHPPLL